MDMTEHKVILEAAALQGLIVAQAIKEHTSRTASDRVVYTPKTPEQLADQATKMAHYMVQPRVV